MRYPSLNHVYRLVWSTAKNAWVAVAETTRARGKSSRSRAVRRTVLATLLAAGSAHAQTALIDGNGNSGCMIGVSTCSLQTSDAVYTNFFTEGGAGSVLVVALLFEPVAQDQARGVVFGFLLGGGQEGRHLGARPGQVGMGSGLSGHDKVPGVAATERLQRTRPGGRRQARELLAVLACEG